MTKGYESWEAAANPIKVVPPMSIGILVATALTIQPMSERTDPEIKNQRRPKRSDKRPTRSCPSAKVKM
jgi:hypothetical protein